MNPKIHSILPLWTALLVAATGSCGAQDDERSSYVAPLRVCVPGVVRCAGSARMLCNDQQSWEKVEECTVPGETCLREDDTTYCGVGLDCPTGEQDGRCLNGSPCRDGDDCVTGACSANFVCVDLHCIDNLQNEDETGPDCGGSCPRCFGDTCSDHLNCVTGYCHQGVCAEPTCTDGVANGSETGTDCGGSCGQCANGQPCREPSDCVSGRCVDQVCAAPLPSCSDNNKNGQETDLDCGGPVCSPCALNRLCVLDRDCLTGFCNFGICQQPTCSDDVQNQGESDVDCGGPCPGCANGEACFGPADCVSGACEGGWCCQANACGFCGATPVETCNGLDDDCDGIADDSGDLEAAPLCWQQQGVCQGAHADCEGYSGWQCDRATFADHSPYYEIVETSCDGRDNDCNGSTDDVSCPSQHDTDCATNQCINGSCQMAPVPIGTTCNYGGWTRYCDRGDCVYADYCRCVGGDGTSYCTYYDPPIDALGADYCSCVSPTTFRWIDDSGETHTLSCSSCESVADYAMVHICFP